MWLNDFSPNINIPGYHLELENRKGKKGGGLAILIKENLNYKSRPDLKEKLKNSQTETCFVELKGSQGNIILGSLYRPPNTPTKEFLDNYTELLHDLNKEKNDRGMIPQITKPTRITQTSATLIDNVMISKKLSSRTKSRILVENISDHLPSLVSIKNYRYTYKEGMKVYSRDTCKNNLDQLRGALQRKNWDLELNPYRHNIDAMSEKFQRVLGEAIDHFTPYRERTINNKRLRKEKWMTGALFFSINKGKKLYKKSISSEASVQDKKKYGDYMLVLRKVKRYARKKYYLDRCVEFRSNTRELWKTINQVIGRNNDKSTCISELKTEKLVIMRQIDIANELGRFFSTVGGGGGQKFANNTPKPEKNLDHYLSLILRNHNSIFLAATNPNEITKLIEKLPNKKSSGYDNIDNILLKAIKNEIVVPLSMIFNKSLSQGIFPTCMKLAEVVPLFKSKDWSEKSNYRQSPCS